MLDLPDHRPLVPVLDPPLAPRAGRAARRVVEHRVDPPRPAGCRWPGGASCGRGRGRACGYGRVTTRGALSQPMKFRGTSPTNFWSRADSSRRNSGLPP